MLLLQTGYAPATHDPHSWSGRAYWLACHTQEEAEDWAETLQSVVNAHRLLAGYYPPAPRSV